MTYIVNPSRFAAGGSSGITYVGSSTSTGNTNIDLTVISGLQENDIVIYLGGSDISRPSAPTGYSFIQGNNSTVFANCQYKFMGATPDTEVAVDSGATQASHIAVVFRGVDTTTPIDNGNNQTTGGSGSPDPGSITTLNDGCMVLCPAVLDDELNEATASPPSGYTMVAKEHESSIYRSTSFISWKLLPSAGAEDPGSYTTNSDTWWAVTFALRPA